MNSRGEPNSRGMSLVELLVCTALSALLACIALPSYRHSMLKARRTDARQALFRVQSLQERYYFEHGRYARTLAELDPETDRRTAEGYYDLAITGTDEGQGYVARATATSSQADDRDCQALMLHDTGQRAATGNPRAAELCWR